MLSLSPLIIIFVFGTILGSFLNCLIYYIEGGRTSLKGRSYCPFCKKTLSWPELIPLLSFIFLHGKCRYCQQKISLHYPLIEFSTGILFVLIFWNLEFGICLGFGIWDLLFYWLIASSLVIIFFYDLKHYIIHDKVIYPAIVIAFLYRLFGIWNFSHWGLFGIWDLGFGILPSLFILAIILLSRGQWMGLGDFKLAVLMGLILGWPNVLVALSLAFFLGAVIGLGLIIVGRKKLKSEVPFGPFLVAGTFLALFFGERLTDWYLNLFLPR